jgi:hypothetical protein
MKQNETKKVPKSSGIFHCELCDYSSSRLSQYNRHVSTQKHKKCENETKMKQNETKKDEKFQCDCGTICNSRTTLWRHNQKCNKKEEIPNKNVELELTDKEIITVLLQQNEKLFKIIENGHTNNNACNIINNLNNVGNKTFNLNLFLNETCKDAFNIIDFVSSIKVTLEDLENTGRQGYIRGITNIFLKNLNNLEHHMRPLHCSDVKREILYIKNNNEWTKEFETKPILTMAIKTIANENIKQIKNWRDKYPDCTDSESKNNNLWLKIVSNSMNGLTEEEGIKNINKIISNVAKEVAINK